MLSPHSSVLYNSRLQMYLGDNCIQNVHLGRYIVGYMVGNFVLRRRISGAVKRNFRPYNRRHTSPNEHFEYSYPHSNALFKHLFVKGTAFCTKLKHRQQR